MNDRDVVCPCLLWQVAINWFQITRGIHTDCLLNYETVKYFNGEEHEGARYREAVREYQALEYKVISMYSAAPSYAVSSALFCHSFSQPSKSGPEFHHRESRLKVEESELILTDICLDRWSLGWINDCRSSCNYRRVITQRLRDFYYIPCSGQ